MHKCIIAIGTNLGNREENIFKSLSMIHSSIASTLICCSSIIETNALLPEQPMAEWNLPFLNCVIHFNTSHSPKYIFTQIKAIETQMGRDLFAPQWSPRIVDIDIILYDKIIYQDEQITIPHAQMHKRDFVLKPLCEIEPHGIHPVLGLKFEDILNNITSHAKFCKTP